MATGGVLGDPFEGSRSARERRVRDVGPPDGRKDQRRLIERCVPGGGEKPISDAEWQRLFGAIADGKKR